MKLSMMRLLLSIKVFFAFFALFLMISCNQLTEFSTSDFDKLYQDAQSNLVQKPDSTIVITQKLIKLGQKTNWNDSKQLKVYQLRQEAFAKTKNMDSVLLNGEKIREIALRNSDSLAVAKSLLPVRGEMDFSAQQKIAPFFPGAIRAFQKNNMKYEQARLGASYGAILCHRGDFLTAQKYLMESLKLFTEMDSLKSTITVNLNIGNAYSYSNSPKKALFFYNKAYELALKYKNQELMPSILMNIGTEYNDSFKNPDKAIYYYKKAMNILPKGSSYYLKMKIDYNIAAASYAKRDYSTSIKIYQTMLDSCNKVKEYEAIAMASGGIANAYYQTQKYKLAEYHISNAIRLADSLELNIDVLSMLPTLRAVYEKNQNYKSALAVSDQIKTLNDSLLSVQKQTEIHEIEAKYDSAKKNIEISNLKKISTYQKLAVGSLSFFSIIVYLLLRHRNILYKEKLVAYRFLMKKYKEGKKARLSLQSNFSNSKGINSEGDDSDEMKSLFIRFVELYENKKPYLDSKLKSETIAKKLQVSTRTITAVLKNNGFSGFNSFNNKFRVDEVKAKFEDSTYANLKMEVIASESGFGSKQSFYSAFEECTGVNPGFYRSEIMKS
jgi:tetratricopeptide (TPR) repeat protein